MSIERYQNQYNPVLREDLHFSLGFKTVNFQLQGYEDYGIIV